MTTDADAEVWELNIGFLFEIIQHFECSTHLLMEAIEKEKAHDKQPHNTV